MKSFCSKILAVIFIVILAAGCTSSITAPQEIQPKKEVTKKEAPASGDITGGGDMQESVEKPEL